MHQPIYFPYESVIETIKKDRFPYSLLDIFNSRSGPYTSWPIDAITTAAKANLPHCGAQVSFSGALQENLNNLETSSLTNSFDAWQQGWIKSQITLNTSLNNPRIYLSAFGYHHPLMPLSEKFFITTQIQLHRLMLSKNMGVPVSSFSKGLFPPENAFSPRIIPALLEAGIEWVLVDNIHFDRAHIEYPWNSGSNLYPPNPADQRNNQTTYWIQLNDIWAPGKVSAPFGYRPYWAEYVDPENGKSSRLQIIPGARYEGVEDGRGGFGAFLYQQVMSQYEFANTDSKRPMIVLLAHDGDNYGGGSDGYYHGNFDSFVSWAQSVESNFECTTVDDYLNRFPVPKEEIIHVEDGSWSGANNGDPQFSKWNANFFSPLYDPDRNSWAVITAASNILLTAQSIAPYSSLSNILSGTGSLTEQALHYFLCGQASDYWYWPTDEIWNSDPTLASNYAIPLAQKVIASGKDNVGPTIFLPQRQFWNPGSINWNSKKPDPSDFGIWTVAYDLSDINSCLLNIRVTPNQKTPSSDNFLYNGGNWTIIPMLKVPLVGNLAPQTNPLPLVIADMYQADVVGITYSLIDYYVSAVDSKGNKNKSPIQHVWVDARVN